MSSVFRLARERAAAAKRAKIGPKDGDKIESPLAKYDANGRLTCAVCASLVGARSGGSLVAWNAHVNSQAHRSKVDETKRLLLGGKRGSDKRNDDEDEPPAKVAVPEAEVTNDDKTKAVEEPPLPEGFFDDPIMDAKARNIQYKNPIEEEWEKFQREMREANTASAAIIAGEQEEATAERQLEEIDEQMRNLSKVLDLNKRKELVARRKSVDADDAAGESADADSDRERDDNFDEYLDWRSKTSFAR